MLKVTKKLVVKKQKVSKFHQLYIQIYFAIMKSYFETNVSEKVHIVQNENISNDRCKFCAREIISFRFHNLKRVRVCSLLHCTFVQYTNA